MYLLLDIFQFSMVEGVASAFIDEYPNLLRRGRRPTIMRTILCGGLFLLGLPMVTRVNLTL